MKPSTSSSTANSARRDAGRLTPPSAVRRAEAEADAAFAPCAAFAGSVIEISAIKDAVPVLAAGGVVSAPYWLPSMVPTHAHLPKSQSSHPAAVPTRGGSDVAMTVKIQVTKAVGLSGTSTLRGRLAGVEWAGSFPSTTGTHAVTVRLARATTQLAAHRGDISWQAEVPGCGTHPVGQTRVEIYRISEPVTPVYLKAGRPVVGLRFIYDNMNIIGVDVAPASGIVQATARITRYLHGSHRMTYDIYKGGVGFLTPVGTSYLFEMKKYIDRNGKNTGSDPSGAATGNMLNCYDQASAVQVFSGILGISGRKRYVEPFGFINTTTLVGGTRTNNPFHGGMPSYNMPATPAVVPQTDPRRTPFGNHEFYIVTETGKVFDACAGPHVGTEDYDKYMAASVDTEMAWSRDKRLGSSGPIRVGGAWKKGFTPDIWRRDLWVFQSDFFQITDIS